jgi:hypothetical protein
MKTSQQLGLLAVVVLLSGQVLGQGPAAGAPAKAPDAATNPWAYSLTVDGYIIPNEISYANPIFTADRNWLHLEARYNDENLRTGSLWAGYNFSAGKKLVLNVTPMIGGVFGRTNGIAPGCEASLTYKEVELSISNEYVFDTTSKSGNFYYAWPQLTYSPVDWFRVGAVAQHTAAYKTAVNIQRGFLVGFSHKEWEFTTYIFNAGWTTPTVVLEVGVSF